MTRKRFRGFAETGLAAVFALLSVAGVAEEGPVTFATHGGEAWTFEKVIEGTVRPGACDLVMVTSPLGSVAAAPQGPRVTARVALMPGDNAVEAECRKNGAGIGPTARQHWTVRLQDGPKAWIRSAIAMHGIAFDAGASEIAPARVAPLVGYQWRAAADNPAPLAGLPAQGRRIVISPPARDGQYSVVLRITDGLGRTSESTAAFRVRGDKVEPVDSRQHPGWVDDAVIYGVTPSRFGPHGLADVTARLDDLVALGVSVLWLMPITPAPKGDFGYAVTDLFGVRGMLGSDTDLRTLILRAHARGLHVILDLVMNHLSDQHPYAVDASACNGASPYAGFFARVPDGRAAHYFNWTNLWNLNYDNPEVRQMMLEASAHWVRDFDADGFRVDAAWGPRERAPEFWARWRTELKRIKSDLLLLAEASARDPYYVRNGFDAAYDWTDRLGQWAWQDAFDNEAGTALRLRAAIEAARGEGVVVRFLNNNDTGPRFVTRYGVARTRVAAAMLLTLPGLPALFTGDEVGAAFEPYGGGGAIAWDDPDGLRPWYKRLIALRRAHAALRGRDVRLIRVGAESVLAYLRPAEDARDSLLVLLNYGAAAVRVALPGDVRQQMVGHGALVDLMSNDAALLESDADIMLPAYGVRILKAE